MPSLQKPFSFCGVLIRSISSPPSFEACVIREEANLCNGENAEQEAAVHNTGASRHTLQRVGPASLPPCPGTSPACSSVDPGRLSSFLSLCIDKRALSEGRQVHDHIIKHGLERDAHLQRLLVHMYGTCEAMEEALLLFAGLPEREVSLWNFIIRTYNWKGRVLETLDFFNQMQHEGTLPDKFTFANILSSCAYHASLYEGIQMHARLSNMRFESELVVGTALVNMYGKNGSLHHAKTMFERISRRDLVLCTAMIGVYAHHQKITDALQLFDQMQQENMRPNKVTFLCLLDASAGCEALFEGELVHHIIIESGVEQDVVVGNALVNMYGKCGSFDEALEVFNTMAGRNAVSWSAIISVHAQNQKSKEALKLYNHMHQQGVKPNRATFVCILEACATCVDRAKGERVHACIVESGCESDQIVATALVNFYSKCGNSEDAEGVFLRVPKKDVVAWNAMIAGCAHRKHLMGALQLFDQMRLERLKPNNATCVSILDACASCAELAEGERMHAYIVNNKIEQDVVLKTALMNMYGKCGKVEAARSMFDNIFDRTVISWNAMISIYAQHGHIQEALMLLDQMQKRGVKPNKLTFVGILDACANSVALGEGKWIHAFVINAGIELDSILGSSLVNMYGKCGSLDNAWSMFDKILEQNVVSMTAMMAVLAKHGLASQVFQLLFLMHQRRLKPNNVTFINILTACNHDGLVEEACRWFASMCEDDQVLPMVDHFICLIDLLGRVGLLDEAECLINIMPFQPAQSSLLALLGACKEQMDMERGDRVANQLLELDPGHFMPYVMLSNIYAAAGRGLDAEKMSSTIVDKDLLSKCIDEDACITST